MIKQTQPTPEQIEENIIYEIPYNWKKHFMSHLPDILSETMYSLVNIVLILTIGQIIFTSMAQSIAMYMYEEHQEDHLH